MCSRPSLGIDQPPYGAVFTLHALHAAHVAAAAHVYTGEPALRRHAAVLRQQHVWLLQNWHALERLAGVPPDDPATVALLLTLGWVQCTSTSVWPGTPSWRALLGGPPPAHWWPRVHWYFCWLLHAPNCSAYRAGLDVALIEGEVDVALGPLAVALRAVLVP